jgi:hypothetical protein
LKVVVACNPLAGHINPLVVVARILVENGHDVVGYTASEHKYRFDKIGARFRSFPADIDRDLSDVSAGFPEGSEVPPGPEMILFDISRIFADPVASQHEGMVALLRDFPADVVLFFVVSQVIAWVFFKQPPTPPIALGGALIISSGLVISLWKT